MKQVAGDGFSHLADALRDGRPMRRRGVAGTSVERIAPAGTRAGGERARSMPRSAAIFRAAGEAFTRPPSMLAGDDTADWRVRGGNSCRCRSRAGGCRGSFARGAGHRRRR